MSVLHRWYGKHLHYMHAYAIHTYVLHQIVCLLCKCKKITLLRNLIYFSLLSAVMKFHTFYRTSSVMKVIKLLSHVV